MARRAFAVAGAALVFTACALAASAGCTFLVTFDDIAEDDSGLTSEPTARPDVAVTDSGGGDEDVVVVPIDGGGGDGGVDYSRACSAAADGKYCNGNGVGVDGGSTDDLITCLNKETVSVRHCTNRCWRMFPGFPDECDECKGKTDGYYCGDTFVGWSPMNKRIKIRCLGGNIATQTECNNTCTGTGPNAVCQ